MSAGVQAVEMRHEVDWVGRIVLMAILAFALWSLVSGVYAGTADDEFKAAADKTSGWVTGNLGKLGALIALGFGICQEGLGRVHGCCLHQSWGRDHRWHHQQSLHSSDLNKGDGHVGADRSVSLRAAPS